MNSCPACRHIVGNGCKFYSNRLLCARYRVLHPIKNAWELDKREKTAKMLLLRAVREYRQILDIHPQRHFSGYYEHTLERIDRKWRMG